MFIVVALVVLRNAARAARDEPNVDIAHCARVLLQCAQEAGADPRALVPWPYRYFRDVDPASHDRGVRQAEGEANGSFGIERGHRQTHRRRCQFVYA